jgi:hypothetical protein
MFDQLRDVIEHMTVELETTAKNNGQPVWVWEGFGHKIRVSFSFDDRWSVLVDLSGETFPASQMEEAKAFAVQRLKQKMIARVNAAEKLHNDMSDLMETA